MTKIAAIVLAGGRGQRFQTKEGEWKDKALALLSGKPLLIHVIENIQNVVDETFVVINKNRTRENRYLDILDRYRQKNVSVVTDLNVKNLRGPLIAILTGLESASADICLVIPADMPLLSRKVASYMINNLEEAFIEVPVWPNGKLETLLMVIQRKAILNLARALCNLERTHPDDLVRGSQNALLMSPLNEIKKLDPELKSFVNINFQDDLSMLKPRQGQGPFHENLIFNFGGLPEKNITSLVKASLWKDKAEFVRASKLFGAAASALQRNQHYFWAALSREFEAKSLTSCSLGSNRNVQLNKIRGAFLEAAQYYSLEARLYEEKGGTFLAERAKADQEWCSSKIETID